MLKDDATMLLNHKEALNFITDNPDYLISLTLSRIEDIHSIDSIGYKNAMLIFYEQNNSSVFKEIFILQFRFAVKTYSKKDKEKIIDYIKRL